MLNWYLAWWNSLHQHICTRHGPSSIYMIEGASSRCLLGEGCEKMIISERKKQDIYREKTEYLFVGVSNRICYKRCMASISHERVGQIRILVFLNEYFLFQSNLLFEACFPRENDVSLGSRLLTFLSRTTVIINFISYKWECIFLSAPAILHWENSWSNFPWSFIFRVKLY